MVATTPATRVKNDRTAASSVMPAEGSDRVPRSITAAAQAVMRSIRRQSTVPAGGCSRYWGYFATERGQGPIPEGRVGHRAASQVGAHPPQPIPIVVVGVDEQTGRRRPLQVDDALQPVRSLRLVIHRGHHHVVHDGKGDGDGVGRAVRGDRRQHPESGGDEPSVRLRLVEDGAHPGGEPHCLMRWPTAAVPSWATNSATPSATSASFANRRVCVSSSISSSSVARACEVEVWTSSRRF